MLPESLLAAYRAAFRYAVIPWLAVLGVVATRARTDNANTVGDGAGHARRGCNCDPARKRAYAVPINAVSGIASTVWPNSRADVLVTLTRGDGRRIAKIFMSNVRVLKIGWTDQRAPDGTPIRSHVATLELTPNAVERLAIAANQGTISLALRGHGDWDQIRTEGAVTSEIVAKELRQLPPRPR